MAHALAQVDNNNLVDTSAYHSSIPLAVSEAHSLYPIHIIPSESITSIPAAGSVGDDNEFKAQAALSLTRATQTNNIVSARSYYDIMFRTSTSGVIKTVEMDFPPGTYVGAALLV
ncbi:MAG: hypothetical protein GEU26_14445, partial [Nitrososphaeraceae archaeon]|nr:hypothetical protein [Nitrososphaeraceae archaeon]